MQKIQIIMSDGKQYEKAFADPAHIQSFLTKLEMFEGLFINLYDTTENQSIRVRINPKFIMRIEEHHMTTSHIDHKQRLSA